jgi:hypothetical protein
MTSAPAGFKPLPAASPFNALVGPLHEKRGAGGISLGSRLAFATGYLCAGGARIVRMSGIFALPGRAPG